jgi:hypothetical protein
MQLCFHLGLCCVCMCVCVCVCVCVCIVQGAGRRFMCDCVVYRGGASICVCVCLCCVGGGASL